MLLLNPYTHDTRVEKEAVSLTDAGYRVTVIAEAGPNLPVEEIRDGVKIRRVRRPAGMPVLRFFRFRGALLRELRRSRPDVIHAHDTETLQLAARAANELRVPFVYDAHDLWLGRQRRGRSRFYWALYRLYYWLIERAYLPRAAAHITVSAPIASHLERRYHLAPVSVVPNVPDAGLMPARRSLRDLPGATDIPPGAPIILYIGHVMSGRGVDQLIAAMADVPGAHLVLLGADAQAKSVESLATRTGLADRVHPLQRVDARDVIDYAADGSIGVSPILPTCLNYRYSLPNKLFQYMAAGIPVVASNFDQVRVVVEGTGAGRVVDPCDPQAIALALCELLDDPVALAEAGHRARAAIENQYNWGVASAELLRLYERVMAARSAT